MAQAGHEVHLLCDYDLERARLYQVINFLNIFLYNSIKIILQYSTYLIWASMKFHFLKRSNGIKEHMSFIDIHHVKKQNYS